jgi:opine dehydrogenase
MTDGLPERATVLGSGAGALTIAGELGLAGVEVTVADFPEFAPNLEPVAERGGVEIRCDWHRSTAAPVARTSDDPAAAAEGAPVVVVSVPSFGHEPFAAALAPVVQDGQTVLWMGEGGGTLSMVAALRNEGRRPDVLLGESNTLPYGARVRAPGALWALRKAGGTLVSALPASNGKAVFDTANAIWPWTSPAENVWETVLLNFNAIDHVATLLLNLGRVESRTGNMLLWGEGATPGVANAIGAVDGELLALREALGLANRRRYPEFLAEQGFVDAVRPTLHETLHASVLASGTFPCGPEALQSRYITEDVPYALVLASSIGREVGVDTPVVDALIAIASAVTGTDWRAQGRTLAVWDLAGAGTDGLRRAAEEGWW